VFPLMKAAWTHSKIRKVSSRQCEVHPGSS
jgi:hypothetical protein